MRGRDIYTLKVYLCNLVIKFRYLSKAISVLDYIEYIAVIHPTTRGDFSEV
jgi:hypothetical protein